MNCPFVGLSIDQMSTSHLDLLTAGQVKTEGWFALFFRAFVGGFVYLR